MEHVIMGAIAMASAVAALFFLRFWRDTATGYSRCSARRFCY